MACRERPKVIMFDIGGVCVVSPFQAILDYELSLGVPPGWINYSISKSGPDGFWHRLEKGGIPMDSDFFAGFNRDLHDPVRWAAFYRAQQAKDPSLPRGSTPPPMPQVDGEWLFTEMMTAARAPDPWMFPALERLRASGKFLLAALSNTVIFPPGHQLADEGDFFGHPLRRIFDVFVSSAHVGLRKPDPEAFRYAERAVDRFARDHAAERDPDGALGWRSGVRPEDVLFIDDIGENLKAGKQRGFRTLKVNLGRAFEAVDELEKITGLALAGDHPRIPVEPKLPPSRTAKI